MSYEFKKSKNHSSRNGTDIEGVILHFTGGGDIDGAIQWQCGGHAKASSHYLVSRSGRVVQLVKESRAAWHAGSSETTPKLNGRKYLNSWTIGIEICNYGWLYEAPEEKKIKFQGKTYTRKKGELYVRYKKWAHPYEGADPVRYHLEYSESKALQYLKKKGRWPGGDAMHWEPYSQRQMNAIKTLVKEIVERYPAITRENVATHADVDPTRKLDMVGDVFDINEVLDHAFPKEEPEEEEYRIGRRKEESANTEEMLEMFDPREEAKKKSIFCFFKP